MVAVALGPKSSAVLVGSLPSRSGAGAAVVAEDGIEASLPVRAWFHAGEDALSAAAGEGRSASASAASKTLTASFAGAHSGEVCGRAADVCLEQYWALYPSETERGTYVLRPVSGWYSFDGSAASAAAAAARESESHADATSDRRRPRVAASAMDAAAVGEAELRAASTLRREIAERCEAIFARRAERAGSSALSLGAVRAQIMRDLRWPLRGAGRREDGKDGHRLGGGEGDAGLDEDEDVAAVARAVASAQDLARMEEVDASGSSRHRDSQETLRMLRALERFEDYGDLSAAAEVLAARAADPSSAAQMEEGDERTTPCCGAWKDSERLSDETGVRRHLRKLKRALKRKADAVAGAEDEAVPETANALLQLKSERGEGLWDFADAEMYSDDEQEVNVFDDLVDPDGAGGGTAACGIAADEDDDEAERGDQLTAHGQQLETLLQKHGGDEDQQDPQESARQSGDVRTTEATSTKASDASKLPARGRQRAKAKVAEASFHPTTATSSSSTVMSSVDAKSKGARIKASGVEAPSAAASVRGTKCPRTQPGASSDDSLPTLDGTAASADGGKTTVPEGDDLRTRAIASLRRRGGTCTLSDAASALGLTNPGSALYQQVVKTLREVADVMRVPGESRPLLVLKATHWSSDPPQGPPDARRWCYLNSDGAVEAARRDAERCPRVGSASTAAGQELYLCAALVAGAAPALDGGEQAKEEWQRRWLPAACAPERCPEPLPTAASEEGADAVAVAIAALQPASAGSGRKESGKV
eukprot:TRINITY_DN1034_c0_g2_i1.p1 TRINITY_DN1034_c0_g2~~TRINITY_DN1034_c0_g2_i1.p1  ORF type:complete len:797 (+),score=192.04 TRINITY_DN1034_c0_g2_i1:95-2392(+)